MIGLLFFALALQVHGGSNTLCVSAAVPALDRQHVPVCETALQAVTVEPTCHLKYAGQEMIIAGTKAVCDDILKHLGDAEEIARILSAATPELERRIARAEQMQRYTDCIRRLHWWQSKRRCK